MISFDCPHCGASLEIDAEYTGSQVECPECETYLTVPQLEPGPGVTLGGFLIQESLGKGAMGEVFLAQQISMDRSVALKILPARLAARQEEVERFLNEVRLAARLEHPHIVTAYEAGEDGGFYYMAMAYIDGQTLGERLEREGALEEAEALAMVRKIAAALDYAWTRHSILHRDIKPSNIMLDAAGEPKLADMGLTARAW